MKGMVLEEQLLLRDEGHVLVATLNRPNKLNAFNPAIMEGLWRALDRADGSKDIHVLLINANGRYFSAGADLMAFPVDADMHTNATGFRRGYRRGMGRMHSLYDAFEAFEKPIVVAHHGPCLGAGLEMSLSCDFRLAATSATYRLPEGDFGLIAGSGGLSRLVRVAGPHWARVLTMTAEDVGANEAKLMGFVHKVYADETFAADVMKFCTALATRGSEFLATAKLAIEICTDVGAAQARNVERLANSTLAMGDQHRQLMRDLLAKAKNR